MKIDVHHNGVTPALASLKGRVLYTVSATQGQGRKSAFLSPDALIVPFDKKSTTRYIG
jgi:hypothetical protein